MQERIRGMFDFANTLAIFPLFLVFMATVASEIMYIISGSMRIKGYFDSRERKD